MEYSIVPAREIFRHFSVLSIGIFYLTALISVGIFAYGVWLRVAKYRGGRAVAQHGLTWARVRETALVVLSHSKLRKRNALAGWAHVLIFFGFLTLLAGTITIWIDHDVLGLFGIHFWKGVFYLWFSATLDLMGLALLVGLAIMAARRWSTQPQFDYSRADRKAGTYSRLGYVRDDTIFLAILFLIGATGFVTEALRILADRPDFEVWSFVGWQLANGLSAVGLSRADANQLHFYCWWLHAILVFTFIAYIPYSKAIHILVDSANLLVRDPVAGKRLPAISEDVAGLGYQRLEDLTWKDRLNLDACTKCGRCHVACPARAGGWQLSPRDVILDLREQAEAKLGGGSLLHETSLAHDGSAGGGLIKPEVLWACTTCMACMEACPVGIEHVPLIVQMRRNLVEQGVMEPNLQKTLEKIGSSGNSFGEAAQNRAKWTQALPFRIKDARKEPVEYLWFVGDYASFDPGLQEITRSVARILHRTGVDFGILYEAEQNSGNDVRRVGEEGLFQMLIENNLAALGQARFKEIITTDPHTYNTLKFEYPEFGGEYRVRHYTELLAELIESGRIPISHPLDAIATYHDPCNLSRYTEVTDAPRAIMQAIGIKLIEMPRNRSNSFCCGAGGGRIWMASPGSEERPSHQRMREALELPDVKYFVVACPKDVVMFREAAAAVQGAGHIQVKEMIELVEMAISETVPALS
ncbi:hypothetical protein AS156_18690 [Bradyrhizobium macuxiense]|uniref:4Fe-4S ferredoxin-type domain-containing protein n=1 Tax=Bradyrhizobium macuxiense TaxID=1755647 RepID=A0A120FJ37_9BRAD|nr:heterodisulfide reductase-related iron-sulfur binding cluster [Bradyrhizobium macuxiense]KWV48499.1 hypothetical protein AS156_18690 [Bradyrhizobium macuxiense]